MKGFTHSFFTALTAGLIAPFLSGSAFTLALGQLALLALGSLCWIFYRRRSSTFNVPGSEFKVPSSKFRVQNRERQLTLTTLNLEL